MDTCITAWYWPTHERWFDEGMARSLRWIREAGFTHVNWNPDAGYSYVYAASEIDHIGDMIETAGLKAWAIHGSDGLNGVTEVGGGMRETRKHFLSPIEWQRQAGVELVRNRLALAERIGSPNVVMHFYFDHDVLNDADSKAAYYDTLFRSMDELRPDCERSGVRIAIENLPNGSLGHTMEHLERVLGRYPADLVGLCYDSGHAQLIDKGRFTILEAFRSRLITTHLNDNRAIRDEHLLPWDGNIDWDRLTTLLADSPCAAPFNFETPYLHHGTGYSTAEPAFYVRAYEPIARIEAMVLAKRAATA